MIDQVISAGTTLAVSKVLPATYTQSGFEALAFTSIKGVRSIGDFGKQHATRPDNSIGAALTAQLRTGAYSYTPLQLELMRLADAGQSILKDAIDDSASYAYRILRKDGSAMYFTAAAMNRVLGVGDANSTHRIAVTLELDADVIEAG